MRLDSERKISPDLRLAFFTARQDDKLPALLYLVKEVRAGPEPTLAPTRQHTRAASPCPPSPKHRCWPLALHCPRSTGPLPSATCSHSQVLPPEQLTIIFAATRHHVEYLSNLMARENIPAACVYGSMDQVRRRLLACWLPEVSASHL